MALSSIALPAFAGKPDPLDKDFLDYLAACEGKDDNWTVIADGKQRRKTADKAADAPPAKPVAPDKAVTKPEAKP